MKPFCIRYRLGLRPVSHGDLGCLQYAIGRTGLLSRQVDARHCAGIGRGRYHGFAARAGMVADRPCARCVMTTVDLQTAEKSPLQEPLKTLAKTRKAIFGMNMIALNSGVVRLGDEVGVLE